jgi:hypothetical protein
VEESKAEQQAGQEQGHGEPGQGQGDQAKEQGNEPEAKQSAQVVLEPVQAEGVKGQGQRQGGETEAEQPMLREKQEDEEPKQGEANTSKRVGGGGLSAYLRLQEMRRLDLEQDPRDYDGEALCSRMMRGLSCCTLHVSATSSCGLASLSASSVVAGATVIQVAWPMGDLYRGCRARDCLESPLRPRRYVSMHMKDLLC